jgi:hypothetical protein
VLAPYINIIPNMKIVKQIIEVNPPPLRAARIRRIGIPSMAQINPIKWVSALIGILTWNVFGLFISKPLSLDFI